MTLLVVLEPLFLLVTIELLLDWDYTLWLVGKYSTASSYVATYFITLVDDYSRTVWVYLLFDKIEVYKMFTSFFSMIDCQFNAKVKVVHSDMILNSIVCVSIMSIMTFYFKHLVLIHLNKMGGLIVNIVIF